MEQLKIPVPEGVTSKSIDIKIKANYIVISYPNMPVPTDGCDEAEQVLASGGCILYGTVHPG